MVISKVPLKQLLLRVQHKVTKHHSGWQKSAEGHQFQMFVTKIHCTIHWLHLGNMDHGHKDADIALGTHFCNRDVSAKHSYHVCDNYQYWFYSVKNVWKSFSSFHQNQQFIFSQQRGPRQSLCVYINTSNMISEYKQRGTTEVKVHEAR